MADTGVVPETIYRDAGAVRLAVRVSRCPKPRFPAVVLLGGTGATALEWDPIAAELCRDRNVFAVDLRGHGDSERPGRYGIDLMARDVAALLPQLAPEVDLVGHSLGGLVGCRVAARPGAGVRRLVLEDVGVLYPRRAAAPPRPEGELDFDWAVVEQVRPEIDDPAADWLAVLGRIELPVLALSGGTTSFLPPEHVDELVAAVRQGRRVTIDAGHEIHSARPREFLDEVQAFLDG